MSTVSLASSQRSSQRPPAGGSTKVDQEVTSPLQETSPEWTTPSPPEAAPSPGAPPAGPLNFKEELERRLSKRLGRPESPCADAEPQTSADVPPESESPDPRPQDATPEAMPAAETPAAGASTPTPPRAKRPPPPPPLQAKARPPPLPGLPIKSSATPSVRSDAGDSTAAAAPQRSQTASFTTSPVGAASGTPAGSAAPTPAAASTRSYCSSEVSSPRSLDLRAAANIQARSNPLPASSAEKRSTISVCSAGSRTPDEPLLFPGPPASKGGNVGSQLSDQRFVAVGQMYSTWQHKNLGDELQLTRGELSEARRRASLLEDEVKVLRQENGWLKKQLDIHNDRDELLRDIRDRVSEGDIFHPSSQQRRGFCGSICSFFGRR